MNVLGIESSCDETACAVVKDGSQILSNVVSSQADLQSLYGGVVPELACRRHVDVLIPIIKQALGEAKLTLKEIDLIAVTHTPGLVGALMIGLNAAKALSLSTGIPFIGVNHVEAHLFAGLMNQDVTFPCLGLVISGGHTALIKMSAVGKYELIGKTQDDAIGEAFDKAAKILGHLYPGGPIIERLAKDGDPSRFSFRAGRVKGRPYDFSFSGLKTAVLYAAKGPGAKFGVAENLTPKEQADLAAAFQEAALSDVVDKSRKAAESEGISTLILGGGVACNQRLRALFHERAPHLKTVWPEKALTLDNAAMIAGLGYHQYQTRGEGDSLDLEAIPAMRF